MRLTKMTHSCVRLEHEDFTIVLDPGSLSEPGAADAADAVLITHEHFDHLAEQQLASAARSNPGVQLWTCRSVAGKLEGIGVPARVVGHGDAFDLGGFAVEVHGERHEITHPDLPPVQNIGFLISAPSAMPGTAPGAAATSHAIFHPGDAFTVPRAHVDTLLAPASAPWMKVPEMIEYVREIGPDRAYSIHEGLLNEAGLGLVDGVLAGLAAERSAAGPGGEPVQGGPGRDGGPGGPGQAAIRRLAPGESVDL
jgi:L-ascorbate metabolism protein UlaG (beta-lactamase superfamily)